MKKKKANLDLEVRKLTKAIIKGSYMEECMNGNGTHCFCNTRMGH